MSVGGIGSSASLAKLPVDLQVGVGVAKKALNQFKAEGAAVNQLIEQAADVQKSSVNGEPVKGRIVDVLA
ncbi:MAG: hypothetical protein AAF078_02440 [Planctomycetota bacterium]